jgi:hypothetical protein
MRVGHRLSMRLVKAIESEWEVNYSGRSVDRASHPLVSILAMRHSLHMVVGCPAPRNHATNRASQDTFVSVLVAMADRHRRVKVL